MKVPRVDCDGARPAKSRINTQRRERLSTDQGLFRARFEDICLEPEPTIERLLAFSGADASDGALLAKAAAVVELSESLGRWPTADPQVVQEAVEVEAEVQKQFRLRLTDCLDPVVAAAAQALRA